MISLGRWMGYVVACSLGALIACVCTLAAEAGSKVRLEKQLRRPAALVELDGKLLAANGSSGSLSIIDLSVGRVVGEYRIAERIADLVRAPQSRSLFALDDKKDELLRVDFDNGFEPVVTSMADVPASTAKLVATEDGRRLIVSAKWPRRLILFDLDERRRRVVGSSELALPFPPQELLAIDSEGILLAADAFGGQIAVIDLPKRELRTVKKLPGHNIRGLCLSPDQQQVLVAHQQIVPRARADYEELHWGRMVTNAVQVFDIDSFQSPDTGDLNDGWLDAQDGIGGATGDPSGVVSSPTGVTAVAFSGVGEIIVRNAGATKRLPVGTYPAAMQIVGDHLYVANRFDDSISMVDLPNGRVMETISLGPQPGLTSQQRGEQLFFDARLSHEGWISCHSCHTDGHSAGLVVDTLGDGDYGAPKRVPSLLGTAASGPWGWTGQSKTLAEQVKKSVETTMHGDSLAEQQVADLVAYLKSLPPAPAATPGSPALLQRGQVVFEFEGCANCHQPSSFTSSGTYDVGLSDERGRSTFNPPSLRGAGQRSSFFHDGRAARLEDVLHRFRHQLERPLTPEDSAALLEYLRSL